jgi:DNA helicase HerA-like ATPase
MSKKKAFFKHITGMCRSKGASIFMSATLLDGETLTDTYVKIPLKTMNRLGLIAGATGTGKTKTLQIIAEQLSQLGAPTLLMDIKGDLSGIAATSSGHKKIDERHEKIGLEFKKRKSLVEIMTISDQDGIRMRAMVSEFGPVLLSRILDVTDSQAGIISVIFKYCDDHKLPLLDLKDLKKVVHYATGAGKEAFQSEYGRISTSSTGAILRKLIELEQQGAQRFFGERSFDVKDLVRKDRDGNTYVKIIRLTDIQDRPKLFSTFMLSLLAEIYSTFPEKGDSDQPELIMFIDEAHLIFDTASKALLGQIENIVKLIRSKGKGLYFVTQNPTDIPEGVLSQLGLKIQHALRALTAKDRKAIKLTAQNYPETDYYDTAGILTSLRIRRSINKCTR